MNNGHIKEEKRVDVKERDLTMLKSRIIVSNRLVVVSDAIAFVWS